MKTGIVRLLCLVKLACFVSMPLTLGATETNLVSNGSFESAESKPGVPDNWICAGNPAIKQTLSLDTGRDGGHCALLSCTAFSGDAPDSHVMLCQLGKIGVQRGKWYRLTFWAKAQEIKAGAVDVGLSDTKNWSSVGLVYAFTPDAEWRRFETLFESKADVPPANSRLQFWFRGTGKLWMDDVAITETTAGMEWFPQIPTNGVKNLLPNSSFECGTASWGSLTYGIRGWEENLFRLECASIDTQNASHGGNCLKISMSPESVPVLYLDYYEPVREPVRRVLAANRGWVKVTPGEPLTLSAYLRSDSEGTAAQMVMKQPERFQNKRVTVDREWRRYEFTFTPSQEYLYVAVGLDLQASGKDSANLWVDAVQLEHGSQATPYEPRKSVESFIQTEQPGNTFTNPAAGLKFTLRAFNNNGSGAVVRGDFALTNFFDQLVYRSTPTLTVAAHGSAQEVMDALCRGTNGYYSATWANGDSMQKVRCAIIVPIGPDQKDSPLAFNHAYPWDFMMDLARQAGIVWWRDWSAKWQTIEPKQGSFDFTPADIQINRVLSKNSQVEVLLPFPSALWSSTAKEDQVIKTAGKNDYLRTRLPVAYAPKDLADFGSYAATVTTHYATNSAHPVTHVQILNEPVYTDYALPRAFGYSLDDYLRLLETAHTAIKGVQPNVQVVGGISAGLDSGFTRQFVEKGGLRWVDVFDLHIYEPARPADSFEESFANLENLMRTNGGPKPVWITEWGCYADDDLPCMPPTYGDDTMNRCGWASERAATEHIVKFTAVAFSHGVRKIFFHAGTSGVINGPDAAGVLFEYGGAPRKMLPGVATLTRLLGVPEQCVRRVVNQDLSACVFQTGSTFTAIAWKTGGSGRQVQLPGPVKACDVMGNPLPSRVSIGTSPVYLVSGDRGAIDGLLDGH